MAEKALVNPTMLRWARGSAGYSRAEAASKMRRPESELASWESGDDSPTIPQARRLAGIYRRTLSVFYLPQPPQEAALPPDYRRTRRDEPAPDLSPHIRWRIRQLHALRQSALDLADEDPAAFPAFPVRATLNTDSALLGARLRRMLGIDVQTQLRWRDSRQAWTAWRRAIEAHGCLVFVIDRVDSREFDGFSLAFDRAPVIALNGHRRLSVARRVFTLLHELTHIALQTEGVCSLSDRASRAEGYCNRVAAVLLMPTSEFTQAATALVHERRTNVWSDPDLSDLAERFRVSRQAAYVRLVTLGLASQDAYDGWTRSHYADERSVDESSTEEEPTEGHPSFYNMYLHRMSFPYLRQVFESYHDERISLSELTDYLGVRPSTALALDDQFMKRLRGRAS